MSILDSFLLQAAASYQKPEPQALVKYEKPKTPRISKAPKAPKASKPEVQAKLEVSAEPTPKKQPSNPFLGLTPGCLLHFPEKFITALRDVQGEQIKEALVLFQYQGYSFQENHGFQIENQVRHAKGVLAREKGLVNSLRAAPIARVVTPLAERRGAADDLVGRLEMALDEVNVLCQKRDALDLNDPSYSQTLVLLALEKERVENIRTSLRRLGIDALGFAKQALRFWS
jgi:hypothetical protein